MNSIINDLHNKLENKFLGSKLLFEIQTNYIQVRSYNSIENEKIINFVKSVGFCPVIKETNLKEVFNFTVVPYTLEENDSDIFVTTHSLIEKPLQNHVFQSYRRVSQILIKGKEESRNKIHYNTNKKNILSAAENLKGDALILGIGSAVDIPLEDLARQFSSITVVDIDLSGAHLAIKNLPASLRDKIIPIQKDLTDLIDDISDKIENSIKFDNAVECLDHAGDMINELLDNQKIRKTNLKYDFIISSMLTSQLFSQIHNFVMNYFRTKFPNIDQEMNNSNKFSAAIHKIFRVTSVYHFDNILNWSKPNTKIYYSDHPKTDFIEPEMDQNGKLTDKFITVSTINALDNTIVDKKISDNFASFKPEVRWSWLTSLPKMSNDFPPLCIKQGWLMQVVGRFLQPLPSTEKKSE